MLYPEFGKYHCEKSSINPLVNHYTGEDGIDFFVEPGFYYGLIGFKEKKADKFSLILKKIYEIIEKEHHVVFTADFEAPFIEVEGYVYKEINDITDPLNIYVEDKSRGSDYGD